MFVQSQAPARLAPRAKSKHAGRKTAQLDLARTGSQEARDEIYAYVAIRDLLLSDAEVTTTPESLRRATMANEFVETCLQPPRSPYEAQYLLQIDVTRERERCTEARNRISALGRKLAATAR